MTLSSTEIRMEIHPGGQHLSAQKDSLRLLRNSCRIIAIALGAAGAWATRSTMFPDGVSYLDLGDAFWRGDWHNAISLYWSPLYPCILGLFIKVFRPSISGEFPLVHLANFLIYVIALFCFEFFLKTFVDQQATSEDPERALPTWTWLVAGYSAFVISSLFLITISFVSGDMLVAAIIFFASGLILKIQHGDATWRTFAFLGVVLGIGYLSKTVMFLMALPFIAVAAATQSGRERKLRSAAISLAFFLLVCAPLVVLLSSNKRKPTFGESGKINYLMNVGTTQFFIPEEADASHPVRKFAAIPEAYEYSYPISGTYPLWFDPAYWHEGIAPRFSFWRQVRTLLLSIAQCAWISFNLRMGLAISVIILFLYLVGDSIRQNVRRAASFWFLWFPAVAGITLYSLVVIEPRYVAALFCILWLVALSGVRLPKSVSKWLVTAAMLALAGSTLIGAGWQISHPLETTAVAAQNIATPVCADVAQALRAEGIKPGDKIAVISEWLFPSRQAAYIARLVRTRIIGEARPKFFWPAQPEIRTSLLAEFAHAGARAVLTRNPPNVETGWKRLADTDYYVYFLPLSQEEHKP